MFTFRSEQSAPRAPCPKRQILRLASEAQNRNEAERMLYPLTESIKILSEDNARLRLKQAPSRLEPIPEVDEATGEHIKQLESKCESLTAKNNDLNDLLRSAWLMLEYWRHESDVRDDYIPRLEAQLRMRRIPVPDIDKSVAIVDARRLPFPGAPHVKRVFRDTKEFNAYCIRMLRSNLNCVVAWSSNYELLDKQARMSLMGLFAAMRLE